MNKKIVFVVNYFYPDPASTAQLITELCLALQDQFQITVIAAQPGGYFGESTQSTRLFETDTLQKIRVIRLGLPRVNKSSKLSRVKYIFTYFILANIALIREKSVDIIYTISTPPVLGGLIGTIGKLVKRTKHVYNIQDFNPEQAAAAQFVKNKAVLRIAEAVDKFSCKHADRVVVVGHDMVNTLRNRFNNKAMPKYEVINNWTDEDEIVPLEKSERHVARFLEENGLLEKFIVMYSGNIGLYYDLENIVKITKQFSNVRDLAFVFIGEGAVKKKMQEFVTHEDIDNVLFLPYQPKDFIKYSLNAADIHLVINQKGIKGVSVPSKIYGVMAAGKPILGVLERDSEAERLITASNCGLVVEPKDYEGICDLIKSFYSMEHNKLEKMGSNGRVYLENHLTKDLSLAKYNQLLVDL